MVTLSGWLTPVYCAIAAPEFITTNPATLKLQCLFVIVLSPGITPFRGRPRLFQTLVPSQRCRHCNPQEGIAAANTWAASPFNLVNRFPDPCEGVLCFVRIASSDTEA
jgi:hypothetical protein